MRILSVRISNYRSFRETGQVHLDPKVSLVIGKNDAGKSSLLECLSTFFEDQPHLSSTSKPRATSPVNPQSQVFFNLEIEGTELRDFVVNGSTAIPFPDFVGFNGDPERVAKLVNDRLSGELYTFGIQVNSGRHCVLVDTDLYRGWSDVSTPNRATTLWMLGTSVDRRHLVCQGGPQNSNISGLGPVIFELLRSRIYRFNAERLKIGKTNSAPQQQLAPDASNLPAVLDFLQSRNRVRFQRFESLVREVFPSIRSITARRSEGNAGDVEVAVSKEEESLERADLYIPLLTSGTGLGQVMALLLAAVQGDTPRVLIVDEPNSFLHPGAARKLVEILKRIGIHQLILSSHAPEVIAEALPAEVIVVRYSDEQHESTVASEVAEERRSRERLFAELGLRVTDVFGAESVLWVEGATEVGIFDVLKGNSEFAWLRRTDVLPLVDVSSIDLRAVERRRAIELVQRLTRGASLVPPAIGFVFDREARSEQSVNEIMSASGGRARFLLRRMTENYLLHADAIAYVINDDGRSARKVEVSEVSDLLAKFLRDPRFFRPFDLDDPSISKACEKSVHGAKVLRDLFWDLVQVEYDKVLHGARIFGWMLEHRRPELDELLRVLLPDRESRSQ